MVNIKINDREVQVKEGTTILRAAEQAHMPIPHLCYLKDINEIGACRVCVVEIKGVNKLIPACNNVVQEGMEIYTNSPRVREARRTNVELILSQHDCLCATCVRSGNCSLQKIANDLGIITTEYARNVPANSWPQDYPLVRDASKCIKCMRCIQICEKVQGVNIWDVAKTGSRTTVGVSHNRRITESDCALCGQCITHCPRRRAARAGRHGEAARAGRRVCRSEQGHRRAGRTRRAHRVGRGAGPDARGGHAAAAGRRAEGARL